MNGLLVKPVIVEIYKYRRNCHNRLVARCRRLGVAGSVQHGRAGPGLRLQRGQGLPGDRHLLVEAGDDTTGRVVLVTSKTGLNF